MSPTRASSLSATLPGSLTRPETTRLNEIRRDVVALTQEAKERAKKLGANAIVGVKIMVDGNARYTFTGTAVRFFPK